MKLVVIGTGYVGLVTGTCLARFGNEVICVDNNEDKVKALRKGEVPFYEPGLSDMMLRNMEEGRLSFSSELESALVDAGTCFITVGTPSAHDGSADLSYIEAAARDIGRIMNSCLTIVVKSTVPVGTNNKVKAWISEEQTKRNFDFKFNMASNPEFLREGAAIRDFVEPDRVVIGTDSLEAMEQMKRLYTFLEPEKILFMDIASAEMAKYAANAMLATRISFMNEMANICELVGANVDNIRRAMALDTRIGNKFLYAGCGYGGSCFPKDVQAFRNFSLSAGYLPRILTAVDEVNISQKETLYKKLSTHFGGNDKLGGLTIAVWGLAFKPKTSDTREAPAQTLIRALLRDGARVQAHDPRAINESRETLGEHQGLLYVHNPYDAVNDADALVVATEWDIYKQPDFERVKRLMKKHVVVDGRNLYSLSDMARKGFEYYSIGRPDVHQASYA